MRRALSVIFFLLAFLFVKTAMFAQQPSVSKEKPFQAGEELIFDLYFKYGILYTKAGKSSISVSRATFEGQDAYKLKLVAESSGAVSKIFSLNDTILSYVTKDVIPLAAFKNAREGGDYTLEETYYTYKDDKTSIRVKRYKNGSSRYDETLTSSNMVYDYLSVVYYARTLDFSNMQIGDKIPIEIISGKKKLSMKLLYQGIERIKANDSIKYNCIKLQLSIGDDAFKDRKEAMKVFLTNDDNKMPIRIESKLKVGETRAIIKSYKGKLHPQNN